MKKISLYNDSEIGGNNSTFIIAEIGSNHNQSLELAKKSIMAAKDSGADAVKFQSINVDELYLKPKKETIALHKKIDLDEEWHYILKDYCDKAGILFFSSPTYLKAVDILEEINVPFYKLASAQIGTFPQIVKKVAETGKAVLLSTGIVLKEELDNIIGIFKKSGNNNYIILHCNSIYPTPFDKVHLNLIAYYKRKYKCPVGFSDHTIGSCVPALAVAMGACVIEKHFTLDKSLPVPDASFSLNPQEFADMVARIRIAEKTIIKGNRRTLEIEEKAFKDSILYKLVLNKDKMQNEVLKENDFDFKRHLKGIDCRDMGKITGRRIISDLKKGTLLDISHLK